MIVIVNRDKRESEINCFDRETISVHDIGFFDVVDDIANDDFFDVITDAVDDVHDVIIDAEKTADFIEVDEDGEIEIGEIVNAIDV